MSMSLKDYLAKENLSPSAWAKKVGIPQPVIARYLSGTRGLSLKTALKISEATGGEVQPQDLGGVEDGNSDPSTPSEATDPTPEEPP